MSGRFLRPGERHKAAFGVSFDVDRDEGGGSGAPAPLPPPRQPPPNQSLADQRRSLSIYEHRTQILYLVERHGTVVIVGETGSGKTTQVPQYLVEAGWTAGGRGAIAVTQPRRVAAMTVAARVAAEAGVTLGREVGYAVRFEDVSTPGATKIKFCTDGVLLREMQSDPLLSSYAAVMVDEAHERSLTTDVLLGLLKKVQRRRPELRIIVASATIQAEAIAAFFDGSTGTAAAATADPSTDPPLPSPRPALLSVEGRPHSVQIHYLEEPCADYVRAAVEAAVALHVEDLPGDILIFLTGREECERAVGWLRDEETRLAAAHARRQHPRPPRRSRLLPVPLYAGLPAAAQLAAFDPAPRGARKVVVATNIAETSVTIEGVVYVIDCMHAKQRCADPLTGLESLLVAFISRASATQRAGRAGRVRPGHAFRLCTQAAFEALPAADVPEMQRAALAGTILQLKSLGIDNVMSFHWLAPPPSEAVVRGLETLHALGALGDDARLTQPLGTRMAELPLDPSLARALLAGAETGCAAEVATVAAALAVQSVWAPGVEGSRAGDALKARFAVAEGDLATYLNVWQAWEDEPLRGRPRWAHSNGVSHRAILRVADVRAQLLAHLRRLGMGQGAPALERTANSEQRADGLRRVLKALVSGLFLNAARLTEEIVVDRTNAEDTGAGVYRLVAAGPGSPGAAVRLRLHPSSVLHRCRPQFVCFTSAAQTDTGWYEMQDVVAVEPGWLTEVAPHYFTLRTG